MRFWNQLADSGPIIYITSSSGLYPLVRGYLETRIIYFSSSANRHYKVLIVAFTQDSDIIYPDLVPLDSSQSPQSEPRYRFGVSQGSLDPSISFSLYIDPISRINTVASCETVKNNQPRNRCMPDVGEELLGLGYSQSTVVSVPVPLPAELLTYWGRGRQFLCIHTLRQANVGLNPIVRKVLAIFSLNNALELLVPYRARTMITHMPL